MSGSGQALSASIGRAACLAVALVLLGWRPAVAAKALDPVRFPMEIMTAQPAVLPIAPGGPSTIIQRMRPRSAIRLSADVADIAVAPVGSITGKKTSGFSVDRDALMIETQIDGVPQFYCGWMRYDPTRPTLHHILCGQDSDGDGTLDKFLADATPVAFRFSLFEVQMLQSVALTPVPYTRVDSAEIPTIAIAAQFRDLSEVKSYGMRKYPKDALDLLVDVPRQYLPMRPNAPDVDHMLRNGIDARMDVDRRKPRTGLDFETAIDPKTPASTSLGGYQFTLTNTPERSFTITGGPPAGAKSAMSLAAYETFGYSRTRAIFVMRGE